MHIHKWTKWSKPFVVDSVRDAGGFGKVATKPDTIQERRCETCDLVKARIVHSGEARKEEHSEE